MICEKCGQNEATVVFTKVVDGEKTERNLCKACMMQEETSFTAQLPGILSAFSSLLQDIQVSPVVRCEKCGISWADFQKSGEVGCAECYNAFRSQLMPVLKRVHGNAKHAGKIPRNAPEASRRRSHAEDLRRRLNDAIGAERYEEAAKLRDELRALEMAARKVETRERQTKG